MGDFHTATLRLSDEQASLREYIFDVMHMSLSPEEAVLFQDILLFKAADADYRDPKTQWTANQVICNDLDGGYAFGHMSPQAAVAGLHILAELALNPDMPPELRVQSVSALMSPLDMCSSPGGSMRHGPNNLDKRKLIDDNAGLVITALNDHIELNRQYPTAQAAPATEAELADARYTQAIALARALKNRLEYREEVAGVTRTQTHLLVETENVHTPVIGLNDPQDLKKRLQGMRLFDEQAHSSTPEELISLRKLMLPPRTNATPEAAPEQGTHPYGTTPGKP